MQDFCQPSPASLKTHDTSTDYSTLRRPMMANFIRLSCVRWEGGRMLWWMIIFLACLWISHSLGDALNLICGFWFWKRLMPKNMDLTRILKKLCQNKLLWTWLGVPLLSTELDLLKCNSKLEMGLCGRELNFGRLMIILSLLVLKIIKILRIREKNNKYIIIVC